MKKDYQLIKSTRTIWNIMAQTEMSNGFEHAPLENTTLNEKFGVTNTNDTSPMFVTTNYFVIGLPIYKTGSTTQKRKHNPKDGALYKHIPFVMRQVTNDISPEEQSKYRLRTFKTINGVSYVLYYMKKAVKESRGFAKVLANRDGSKTIEDFMHNEPTILNPLTREENIIDPLTANDVITYIKKITLVITPDEMKDMMFAVSILYGDDVKPTLGELGLCGAKDVIINNRVEAIGTQIHYFVEIDYDIERFKSFGLPITQVVDIGGGEPLCYG